MSYARWLIALSALTAASGASAQPGSYRAIGTEPFWSVKVERGRMVYDDAEGRRISVPVPRAQPMRAGRRYVSRRLSMTVYRGRECSDGMSDRRYSDTVRVTADGRRLEGCGGAIMAPATLAGTSWEIVAINGRPVPGGERYRMQFDANRLTGKGGCNGFGGNYRVGSDGFQAGPLAITRMACPGFAMAHEQAVSRILAGRLRLYYPDGSTMIMRGEAGEIRLRRAI